MPRILTDYSKALIYKIVCNDLKIKECYYGSTTDFIKRKCQHKTSCNNSNSKKYNYPVYQFIRENGGWDNWKMVLVKYYPCNNKLELEREERLCMEQNDNRLNNKLPTRTLQEYYIENVDKYRTYFKEYYIENVDKLKEKQKQYNIDNADKIKQYRIENADKLKEQRKQYYIDNADKIKAYKKQHYLKNKNKNKTLVIVEEFS